MTPTGAAHRESCSCARVLEARELRWGIFKGRTSHSAHLLGVPCFFPNLIPPRVIHGSAGWVRGAGLWLGGGTAASELPWPESGWGADRPPGAEHRGGVQPTKPPRKRGLLHLLGRHGCSPHLSFDGLSFPLEEALWVHRWRIELEDVLKLGA